MVSVIGNTVPTYFLRYEDLRLDPERVLSELLQFLLDVDSIEGTIVQERIRKYCMGGYQSKASYKLKSTSSSLSRNRHAYTDEQFKMMKEVLGDYIKFYGYTG